MPADTLLVVLRDPDADASAIVAKVGQVARALQANVELYCPLGPLLQGALAVYANLVPETQQCAVGTQAERRLAEFAAPLREQGFAVSIHVDVDPGVTVPQAVARRATHLPARLVIVPHEAFGHATRWLRLSDWELVRLCPAALLLVKDPRPYSTAPLLAAVDPLHANDKPEKLDRAILAQARRLAAPLHASLHVVHVVAPPPLMAMPVNFASAEAMELLRTAAEEQARTAVTALLQEENIDAQVHFRFDAPHLSIAATAEAIGCQLVVMGAMSRSPLKRLLVGDTARRTLDDLGCDVLIVKAPLPET